jgi:hypothetical protein
MLWTMSLFSGLMPNRDKSFEVSKAPQKTMISSMALKDFSYSPSTETLTLVTVVLLLLILLDLVEELT